ncbi:MAG: nitroreductase family deazaflavin-dependent oxidoreductase [Anaerolineales bacterium]|jgi:deazaflavin-dependent oxidoreductase (nitroreductase family)
MHIMRRVFRLLNRFFMVPIFRLGLGPFVGNPLTGYIMVLKTIGRKTGKTRYTPVNYALKNGCVYCMVGFGKASHWYKNLKANPNLEVILPSRPIAGVAEEVTDPEEALAVARQLFKNSGFAVIFEGYLPFRAIPDEKIEAVLKRVRILRIRPVGVGSGASDPSGWLWLSWVALAILLIYCHLR